MRKKGVTQPESSDLEPEEIHILSDTEEVFEDPVPEGLPIEVITLKKESNLNCILLKCLRNNFIMYEILLLQQAILRLQPNRVAVPKYNHLIVTSRPCVEQTG